MKYSALFQSSKGREMGKELQELSISCLLSFLFPLFASPLLQKMGADGLKMSRMASTCPGEFSQRKYNQPGQTTFQASGIRKSAASTGLISLCLAAVDWCRMANLSFCNNFQIRKSCDVRRKRAFSMSSHPYQGRILPLIFAEKESDRCSPSY